MRDFPFFTTEYGVASLVLREVPYREEAYIHIQEAQPEHLTEHIQQCRDFCRAVGAEHIYIKEYPGLPQLPLHTQMVQMSGTAWVDLEKLCALFPVTEATVGRWRAYHNRRMAGVDNAATLEAREEGKILESDGAYFVHQDGQLLGIGWLEDTKLLTVAAEPGQGERVMHSLMSLVEGAQMTLEVASTNKRALALYQRLGFVATRPLDSWYRLD